MAARSRLRPRVRAALILALLLLGLIAPAALSQEPRPTRPTAVDRCAVCGMFIAKHPNWTATIMTKAGPAVFFDGPKDMFTFLFAPAKYRPSAQPSDVAGIFVLDYYSVTPIDGRKAHYVPGSDVRGPMGAELIPFEKLSDAQEFRKDHGGTAVLPFDAVTPDVLSGLR